MGLWNGFMYCGIFSFNFNHFMLLSRSAKNMKLLKLRLKMAIYRISINRAPFYHSIFCAASICDFWKPLWFLRFSRLLFVGALFRGGDLIVEIRYITRNTVIGLKLIDSKKSKITTSITQRSVVLPNFRARFSLDH